jgi:hypothetical protein
MNKRAIPASQPGFMKHPHKISGSVYGKEKEEHSSTSASI